MHLKPFMYSISYSTKDFLAFDQSVADQGLSRWLQKNLDHIHNYYKFQELQNKHQIYITHSVSMPFAAEITTDISGKIKNLITVMVDTDDIYFEKASKLFIAGLDSLKENGHVEDNVTCVMAMQKQTIINYLYINAELIEEPYWFIFRKKKVRFTINSYDCIVLHDHLNKKIEELNV